MGCLGFFSGRKSGESPQEITLDLLRNEGVAISGDPLKWVVTKPRDGRRLVAEAEGRALFCLAGQVYLAVQRRVETVEELPGGVPCEGIPNLRYTGWVPVGKPVITNNRSRFTAEERNLAEQYLHRILR